GRQGHRPGRLWAPRVLSRGRFPGGLAMMPRWTNGTVVLLLAFGTLVGCNGLEAFRQGDRPAAPVETKTTRAKELPPDQAALVCWNAAEEMRKAGLDREAIAQYEKVRDADPNRPRVAWRLAVLYDKQGDSARALAEYQ